MPIGGRGVGKRSRAAASLFPTAVVKLGAVLELPGSLFVATAAREVGSILNSCVPSCGRRAGTISRATASPPLTAVLKRAAVRNVQAESSFAATAARGAGSILKSSVSSCDSGTEKNASCARVAGIKSRVGASLAAILRVRARSGSSGIRGGKTVSITLSSGPEEGRSGGEEHRWEAWKTLHPGVSDALRPRAESDDSTLSAVPGGLDGRGHECGVKNDKPQGLAGYARQALRRVRRAPAQSGRSWLKALSGARWLGR